MAEVAAVQPANKSTSTLSPDLQQPYAIRFSPELGRYLVATRDIAPLEIIIKEKPIVSGPSDSVNHTSDSGGGGGGGFVSASGGDDCPKCLGCCTQLTVENKYNRCSKCFWPVCNETCEKMPNHAQNECIYFCKNNVLYPPPYVKSVLNKCILILRMLLLKYQNTAQLHLWNRIMEMESHKELRAIKLTSTANDEKILANFDSFMRQSKYRTTTGGGNSGNGAAGADGNNNLVGSFAHEEIIKLSGIIDTNAHVLPQSIKNETTYQIFPESSLFSHDCSPNAEWSIIHADTNCETEINLVTRATIPILAGQTINVCYDDSEIMYGTIRRLIPMEIAGLFICKCERCMDSTELGTYFSAIKCTTCKTGFLLPKNPVCSFSDWKCTNSASSSHCTVTATDEQVLDLIQGLEEQIEFPKACKIGNTSGGATSAEIVEKLQYFVKKCSGIILHPNHFILQEVRLRIVAEESSSLESLTLKRVQLFVDNCKHVLQLADTLSPGLSEYRTIVMFHLARGLLMLQRKKETQQPVPPKLSQRTKFRNKASKVQAVSASSKEDVLKTYQEIAKLQEDALSYFRIGNNKWAPILEKDLTYVKEYISKNSASSDPSSVEADLALGN